MQICRHNFFFGGGLFVTREIGTVIDKLTDLQNFSGGGKLIHPEQVMADEDRITNKPPGVKFKFKVTVQKRYIILLQQIIIFNGNTV